MFLLSALLSPPAVQFWYCCGTRKFPLSDPSHSLSIQVFPPRLLPHPDAVGVGAAGRGTRRHGAVTSRVVGYSARISQVSWRQGGLRVMSVHLKVNDLWTLKTLPWCKMSKMFSSFFSSQANRVHCVESSFSLFLCSCISPLRYCSDFRPYFTIHDSEFKEYTTRTHAPWVTPTLHSASFRMLIYTNHFSKHLRRWNAYDSGKFLS